MTPSNPRRSSQGAARRSASPISSPSAAPVPASSPAQSAAAAVTPARASVFARPGSLYRLRPMEFGIEFVDVDKEGASPSATFLILAAFFYITAGMVAHLAVLGPAVSIASAASWTIIVLWPLVLAVVAVAIVFLRTFIVGLLASFDVVGDDLLEVWVMLRRWWARQ